MPVMNEDQVSAAGAALFAAERDRSQTRLISAAHPGMDMDDAYAVQADFVARKLAAGGSIRGWKIGLTSKAMQYALNIDIPDSGVLFADMFFDHGGTVPAGRFIEPRIEAEIAFIMDSDLAGAEVAGADVVAAPGPSRRRWKFWIRAFSAPIRKPARSASCLIPFRIMPPMPVWCWATAGTPSMPSTCAGSGRSPPAMARSRRPGSAPVC